MRPLRDGVSPTPPRAAPTECRRGGRHAHHFAGDCGGVPAEPASDTTSTTRSRPSRPRPSSSAAEPTWRPRPRTHATWRQPSPVPPTCTDPTPGTCFSKKARSSAHAINSAMGLHPRSVRTGCAAEPVGVPPQLARPAARCCCVLKLRRKLVYANRTQRSRACTRRSLISAMDFSSALMRRLVSGEVLGPAHPVAVFPQRVAEHALSSSDGPDHRKRVGEGCLHGQDAT